MSVQIKTPNITAATDRERLQQIQSYLYQMAQQLQWAFDTIDTGGSTGTAAGIMVPGQQTTAKSDPAATFSELKSLIIKSADIVNAYYETISKRLEGVYVAQSDFGTYAQETALEIQATAQGLQQLYTNMQEISDTVDSLYDSTISTNAYLKSGLLDEKPDGTPIYGLEIGQSNTVNGVAVFDKFARFSSDRLSFYDSSDVEVAYISDYKLHITNAEITGSLWLSGRFKIYYKGGLAFQWIGGDS